MYTFDGNIVSDLHKDAYGYRPREYFWAEWNNSTDADKQHIWDRLIQDLQLAMEEEAQQEIAAINAFELEIADALDLGAPSREDAVRWIVDGMNLSDVDIMYGSNYICYLKGLPYKMAYLFDNVVNSMMKEAA